MQFAYDRANKETEAAVNRGLAAAKLWGLPTGARIMSEEEVPITVAARVLLKPQFRRDTDWKG